MTTSLSFQNNCSQLAGKGKKLVTVFAICSLPSTGTSIMATIHQLSKLFTRTANTAPWWLARRDSFASKALGQVAGGTAPPPLSAPTRGPL